MMPLSKANNTQKYKDGALLGFESFIHLALKISRNSFEMVNWTDSLFAEKEIRSRPRDNLEFIWAFGIR